MGKINDGEQAFPVALAEKRKVSLDDLARLTLAAFIPWVFGWRVFRLRPERRQCRHQQYQVEEFLGMNHQRIVPQGLPICLR